MTAGNDAPARAGEDGPPLPTFLIVGTMKSGTTTLADLLDQHPDVFMAPGEVHFFSDDEAWARGLDHYRAAFEGWSGEAEVGEKTPAYCYKPGVEDRIAEALPDVRLVWIFRDPVRRAYSNYWHAVRRGIEPLSFGEAVAAEPDRLERGEIWRGYVERSRYVGQVERFLEHFPRDRMHFALFEDLVEDPVRVARDVFGFLGVDADVRVHKATHSNPTHLPASRRLQHVARRLLGDSTLFRLVSRINRRFAPGYPPMDPDVRASLVDEFEEHNREFERLTGLSVEAWST